jgi:UDP-N-acetyl-D-mannosaminuronate dehydrogenase
MNKKKVLVVGLGETGLPIYQLLSDSKKFDVYGYDAKDPNSVLHPDIVLPIEHKVDFLHICIPFIKDFENVVIDYIKEYKPFLTIIHSTVEPFTTRSIWRKIQDMPHQGFHSVVHSPIRGLHKTMYKDIKLYVKYVGAMDPLARDLAETHLRDMGLKVKVMGMPEETELGKLFETSCYGAMIAIWQEMERISRCMNIDFINATSFLRDTDKVRQDRPMFYPDVIGGHCVIPNIELLLNAANKCRPKPSVVVFLNAWRSNNLTKIDPPSERVLEKMKELFKKSRKSRK